MVEQKDSKNVDTSNNKTMAIIALIVNIFFPGIGTVIGASKPEFKKYMTQGVIQIILLIISMVLYMTIIGIPIAMLIGLINWIWALVLGIKMVSN